jgi:hypothetical protein
MNEQDLGRKIARQLDQSIDQLPAATLYKLRAAREAALTHAREPALTNVGRGVLAGGHRWAPGRRFAAPLAGLVLALLMLLYWQSLQQQQHNPDFADIDAEVLTDDLPVTAYLDQGFEVWLYHQPENSEQ